MVTKLTIELFMNFYIVSREHRISIRRGCMVNETDVTCTEDLIQYTLLTPSLPAEVSFESTLYEL